MRTAIKNKSGFTFPEVIVASALLIIALVPILKALTQINLNSVLIERRTQSLCLAKAKMNRIQAESIYNFDKNFAQNNLALGNSFLCNVSSQSVNTNLTSITVSVGKDRNSNGSLASNEIEVSLQTQIARR